MDKKTMEKCWVWAHFLCGGPAHCEIRLGLLLLLIFLDRVISCSQGGREREQRSEIESESETEKRRKFRQQLPTAAAALLTVGSG